ncbi:F390 synthetase-related protein [Thaumasiovibrio subtropicus]|nr:F390 synthetase-related protein [Thaumasiovibrio subtropicus]
MKALTFAKDFMHARWPRFRHRAQLEQWQQRRLSQQLDWVCAHSPFYAPYRGRALTDFPIMDKATMMDNLDSLNTQGLSSTDLMATALHAEQSRQFSDSKLGNITVGLSSGTSGRRGLFLASDDERALWAASITGKLLPSLVKKQRIALLLRADSPLYHSVKRGRIAFHYCDLTQPLSTWLPQLEGFNPTLMVGSAQALMLAASHQKTLAPDRVISGAEVLTQEDRHWLEAQLRCDVHEIYQCTEGFLACSDQHGTLRWNEDLIYLEKEWIDTDKTHYVPIITDLKRTTQPIIRYRLDDIIEHRQDDGIFAAINRIVGRCGDCFSLPAANTEQKAISVLPDLISRTITLHAFPQCNYRISQIGHALVSVEAPNEQHHVIAKGLQALFKQLGSSDIQFQFAPEPLWQPSVKQRRVVNQHNPPFAASTLRSMP